MKKKNFIFKNNEINLGELLKILWNEKIKIALIASIIFIIIFNYNNYKSKKPNSYKSTLMIKQVQKSEFSIFNYINNYIALYSSNGIPNIKINKITTSEVLNRFYIELSDSKEILTVLKNNKKIKKDLSQLSEYDQIQKLYRYRELFSVVQTPNADFSYTLTFTFQDDKNEIANIIDQVFKLTLINLRESFFLELENFYELEKALFINKNLERLEYLLEQKTIAKKLGISEQYKISMNDLFLTKLLENQKNNTIFNENSNTPYYLRGHKAIGIEIDLIKNRKNIKLEKIRKEIDLLKQKDIKWVDYNLFLIDTELKDANKNLSLSIIILFSLMIGVFYVIISNAFPSHKATRKT